MAQEHKVIIIGAGASGIGFGVALKEFGIDDFLILEQDSIGSSFRKWPKETRFITPSFTSNGFGMSDLNAVSIRTSPAFTIEKEHLNGAEYAEYLELVAEGYTLPIKENTKVMAIEPHARGYRLTCETQTYFAKYLVMAVGESQFPKDRQFNSGVHYANIQSWARLEGDTFTIVGGNESAIDAAINLIDRGKKVKVYTRSSGLNQDSADPSIRLSPYTRERLLDVLKRSPHDDSLTIKEKIETTNIIQTKQGYEIHTNNQGIIHTQTEPIICTGFINGVDVVSKNLFKFDDSGTAILSDVDESTLMNNAFMLGPSVRHKKAIFCYIYKFRQRFALIAETIAKREDITIKEGLIQSYKDASFYLDDCDGCEVRCKC